MNVFYENLIVDEYQGTIVAFTVLFLVLGVSNIYEALPLRNKFKYFVRRNEFSFIALASSIVLIAICTFSLSHWFPIKDKYSQIENYIYVSTIILIISTFFSVVEWALSVADKNSFIINTQYVENFHSKSKKAASERKLLYSDRLRRLEQYGILFEYETSFVEVSTESTWLSVLDWIETCDISTENITEIIGTSNDQLFFAIRKTIIGKGRSTWYEYQFVIIYQEVAYDFLPSKNVSTSKLEKLRKEGMLEFVRNLATEEKHYLNDMIRIEDQILDGKITIPFHDFIFNNMFELFSIRQGYFVPYSFIAKVVHFVFGVYKFLFLGALISLLLQK